LSCTFEHYSFSLSWFKKVLLYISLGLLIVIIGAAISIYVFKDRILQEFIDEANKSLNTPVKIGKIEISAWQDFPNLAIVFTDVYVEDSHPEDYPLITAKKVSFFLNPIEAWNGNYSIQGLQIKDSETSLKIDKTGENNFTIVKPTKQKSPVISFDLKNVKLINTLVSYRDEQSLQNHTFSSEQLTSSISILGDVYKIVAKGDATIQQIGINKKLFLRDKRLTLVASVDYDDVKKNIAINSANLKINKSVFDVTGSYSFKKKNLIDLKAKGKETDIQTLLALLPDDVNKKLKQYQSKGDVFFDLKLKGEISKHKDPFISIRFGCKDATFTHVEFKSKIEHANLEGSFATPSLTKLAEANLSLKNITGDINGKSFSSNLSIFNFDNPSVQFDFKGELDASSIQNFYPLPDIHEMTGTLIADFSMVGETRLLKNKATSQQVKTTGQIDLKNINFVYGEKNVRFKQLNGTLQFNKNDLAMSDFKGQLENSDFVINGLFKNMITFLLFEDQPIGIEADIKSNYLDVDQLFQLAYGETSSKAYKFKISPQVQLNLNCDVKKLTYKKFHPSQIKGHLLVKNQVAVSRAIAMKTMGGDLKLNGIVDAKNPRSIDVVSTLNLDGIYLDSVFYVFEDFNQNFIEYRHLKGQAFADVNLEMALAEDLKLLPTTLIADIALTVKNGELNDFKPLQSLNKYLDDGSLSKLRFADLKNDIHIENETIYIPQMEIKTNATSLHLSGTHAFDQKINYHIVAPLRSKKKIDPDEAFGAIEETAKGQTRVFLKITGTTTNYKISYDKEAVKKKIVSDLKKEVRELKEAFQLRGKKKKKEIELEKDEYFNWEN
jgi:hypothetical protein